MSHFNLSGAAFGPPPPPFLIPTFLGAFVPFLRKSFGKDGGLVKNLLKVPDSLGRRYADGLIDRYFRVNNCY